MDINTTIGKALLIFETVAIFMWMVMIFVKKNSERTSSDKYPSRRVIITVPMLLVAVILFLFCNFHPKTIDRALLLEYKRPVYWQWLARANTTLVESDGEVYILTTVGKEGFGSISCDDLKYYLMTLKNKYPDADRAIIAFTDGTGIEIQDNDLSKVVYGKLDDHGNVEVEKIIDTTTSLMPQIDDLTVIQYEYNDNWNPIYEKHIDKYGDAIADANGVAEYYREYDNWNHIIWEKRIGPDGLPVLNPSGTAEFRRTYDISYLTSESYYDGNGNPVNLTDKLYAEIKIERDKVGNIITEQYFDTTGAPVCSDAGYACIRRVYDMFCLLSEAFYGADGGLIMTGGGYASRTREYDDKYNLIREIYYGTDNEPIVLPAGYASYTCAYDETNHLISQEFYGADGERTILPSGYSAIARTYDENWNVNSERYFDTDGNPCVITAGYASYSRIFDDNKNIIDEKYFDPDGKPVALLNGFAEVKREYSGSDLTYEAYYDVAGEPVNRLDILYSSIDIEYDENHNRIREQYYDSSGAPVCSSAGFASITRGFDVNRNVIEECYYDIDGSAKVTPNGYTQVKRVYKGSDLIHEAYYDVTGNPVNRIDILYASIDIEYDENHNRIREQYYDSQGNPCVNTNGVACVVRVFNDSNRIISEEYYGTGGESVLCTGGYAHREYEYDEVGNIITESYRDGNGQLVLNTSGYAIVQRSFNEKNKLLAESYYGVDEKPINIGASQYAGYRNEYDDEGDLSLTQFHNADGQAVECGSSYFHEYLVKLRALMDSYEDTIIIISAKDEASNALTKTLVADMRALGLETDLTGKFRNSFYAVITPEGVKEEVSTEALAYSGDYYGFEYSVVSAGFTVGNTSSIIINGNEYSKKTRGLNFAVLNNGVIEAVSFDTFTLEMYVTR